MIVVRLIGGLGNQMFQYATGRALARKNNDELLVDLSAIEKKAVGFTQRNFELDQLNIKGRIAKKPDLQNFKSDGFFARLKNKSGLFDYRVFNENQFAFMPEVLKLKGNVLLNGYWQSHRYFSQIRKDLLVDFTPAFEISVEGKALLDLINSCNAVSVHVRRGDYISLPGAAAHHVSQGMDYYKKAMGQFSQKVSDPRFFIFSDDINWCKENFGNDSPFFFVEGGDKKKSAEDLLLMSKCKGNIIANSSFSWWAAWLNENPGKMVIAPSKWFHDSKIDISDLMPGDWIKI